MRKCITTLMMLAAIGSAAAQECTAEQSVMRRVDCEQRWVLDRAISDARDVDIVSAYSILKLALAQHYVDGNITHETYDRLDATAIEMLLSTISARRGQK